MKHAYKVKIGNDWTVVRNGSDLDAFITTALKVGTKMSEITIIIVSSRSFKVVK